MSEEKLRSLSEREQVLLFIIDSVNGVTHDEAEEMVELFVERADKLRYDGPAPSFVGDDFSHAWNKLITHEVIERVTDSPMSYGVNGEVEFDYSHNNNSDSDDEMRFEARYEGEICDVIFEDSGDEERMSGQIGVDHVARDVLGYPHGK